MKAERLAELGVLTASALIIFIIEGWIPYPFPIPGIKLGLANIITVYAVYRYRAYEAAAVVIVRILLGAVFSGNPAMLIYSMSGSALCVVGMILLKKVIDEKMLWLAGVFGAVLHNTGQIIAAVLVLQTWAILAYYPFLIVAGCLSGLFTGLCAQIVIKRLQKKTS